MASRMSVRTGSLLVAFGAGAVAIVLFRMMFPEPHWLGASCAAAAAVAIIAALAVYYYGYHVPEDMERAGDNLYYLGFLFTLVSLIYALIHLFMLEDRDTPLDERTYVLIGNFGIALLSTVAGILGRLILHDGSEERRISNEIPKTGSLPTSRPGASTASPRPPSRTGVGFGERDLDLDLLVRRLRAEIRDAIDVVGHFNRMTTHQAADTKRHAERMVGEFTRKLETDTRDIVARTGDDYRTLVEQARAAGGAVRERVTGVVDGLGPVLEQFSSVDRVLSGLPAHVEQVQRSMDVFGESAKTAATRLDEGISGISEVHEALARTAHEQRTITAQMMEFRAVISPLVEQLETTNRYFSELAVNMEQTRIGLSSINESVTAAATGLDGRTDELARASDSLARSAREQGAILERSRETGAAIAGLVDQLGSASDSLAALTDHSGRTRQSMDAFGKSADDSAGSLHDRAAEAAAAWETLARSAQEQQRIVERMLEGAMALNTRMDSESSEWTRSFEESRTAFKDIARAAGALATLVEQLEPVTRSLAEFSEQPGRIGHDGSGPDDLSDTATNDLTVRSAPDPSRRLDERISSWFRKKT